jgi:hypothetical protein
MIPIPAQERDLGPAGTMKRPHAINGDRYFFRIAFRMSADRKVGCGCVPNWVSIQAAKNSRPVFTV